MSVIFGIVGSVYSILDDINEEEDFAIEEIRYCDCFFDEFQYFIRKNNFRIGFTEVLNEFCHIPKNFRMELFLMYYSKLSIFCCLACVDFITNSVLSRMKSTGNIAVCIIDSSY